MATGDTKIMANYLEAVHNLTPAVNWDTDAIKIALVTTSTTPDRGDSNPCFGAGGSQNYATNEIAATGAYTAGGVTLTGCTIVQTTTALALNATSPITWAANASSPTNARWAIIYDNTVANKEVIGYIDLGGVTSLVPGLQINFNSVSSGVQPVFNGTTT